MIDLYNSAFHKNNIHKKNIPSMNKKMTDLKSCEMTIHGLEKYKQSYLYIQSNTGYEYLYQDKSLTRINLDSAESTATSNLDQFVEISINNNIKIVVNNKQHVLFHCVLQVVESHPDLEYIYRRPHVVGCLIVTRADISIKHNKLEFGLNSNYQYDLPYNNCLVYMKINTPLYCEGPTNLTFPKNPIHEFFKIPRHHIHGKIPIIPTWIIEGIDAKSWEKAIDFGVPINYLYKFDPSVPFVSASYLKKRYIELCNVFGIEINTMLEYLKLYPANSNDIDNQFCEGFMIKMATTEVTTRPYMKDFQIDSRTNDIVNTDYYMLFKYTIGDCAFDANIIYRIWMSILFCEYNDNDEYLNVLKTTLAKIGVPVVIKGHAGLHKNATFGHMFSALVKPDRFSKIIDDADFSAQWQTYFKLSANDFMSKRVETVIIGEGTTPATAHYSSHRKSDPSINICELKEEYDAPWTFFTHPVHIDDSRRFHREVLEIFTWVIPILKNNEYAPCAGTMWHYHNGKSCSELQIEKIRDDIKAEDVGKLITAQQHNMYIQLLREYYFPDYTITINNKDLHTYQGTNLIIHLSNMNITNNDLKKLEIAKFVYVYHVDEKNLTKLQTETQKYPYSISKCGYSLVITLFKNL